MTGPPGAGAARWPGADPAWSRRVGAGGHDWHVLDNATTLAGPARGTILAVHGNPTWSYLWRSVLAAGAEHGWRVVAVDQLEMGFSERTGSPARLAGRVRDLGDLTDALGLSGPAWDGLPVVALGHDWGGVVVSGWAVDHPRELAALALTNTAVHQPEDRRVPFLLRLAQHRSVHLAATRTVPAFLETTLALARPGLPADVKDAYRAPYTTADRRAGIAGFVEDIPLDAAHPSRPELDRIAQGLTGLGVPALVMWGPGDPVFKERYLRDLMARLPHADVHRFEGAGHLVVEDADVAGTLATWLERTFPPAGSAGEDSGAPGAAADAPAPPGTDYRPLYAALTDLAGSGKTAVVSLADGGTSVTWEELAARVHALALGLADSGVRAGHRVSLLVPPGVDLTTALFACLRLGAVVVLADAGLGLRGLTRAVRGAGPDHVLGTQAALLAARALGWPGRKYVVVAGGHDPAYLPPRTAHSRRKYIGIAGSLRELLVRGRALAAAGTDLPPEPAPDDDAAILFTSGSTGPAKGVVHTHRGLAGMRDATAAAYGLSPARPFVAGFAPFALLGTATGATSATPDMSVTAPGSLTAVALADAVAAIDATAVFTSPAALDSVVATAGDLTAEHRRVLAGVELFLCAGAPVSPERLARVHEVLPGAEAHTPYGMTEVLPVTDVTLEQIQVAQADAAAGVPGAGGGTCVGRPVPGARVLLVPLDADGAATGEPTADPGVLGEVLVSAPNLKDRYDRLWATQDRSATWPGWHRTGDVGHLDAGGRLWIEGRLGHVITTPRGVLTPVALENAALSVRGVRRAAAVGVGPAGTQQVVLVLETDPAADRAARRGPALAPPGLAAAVRSAAGDVPVAAVVRVPQVPTDVRHNSKVERARVARWAERFLAGERAGTP